MASDLEHNMRATTETFLYAWDGDWTSQTNQASLAVRAPECQHTMVPEHLGIPTRNNKDWSEYFSHIEGRITKAKMTIHDYVANLKERRVAVYSSLEATTPIGPFRNEYVWFLDFDEDGTKITGIKEFLDSHATKEFRARMAEEAK